MDKGIYETRLHYAHRYFEFLNRFKNSSWVEKLLTINEDDSAGIPEVLVLLNPETYAEIGVKDPRGAPTFQSAPTNAKCRSKELWGYECPFVNAQIHVDHSFPRNRGGMTHPENAMYLCRDHNLSKSTDIHLIRWEVMPIMNAWILIQLKTLILSAQRNSNEKLYLPENQLSRL